jgi:hypothetical protein
LLSVKIICTGKVSALTNGVVSTILINIP